MESRNYKVDIATTYSESRRSSELEVVWNQVTNCLTEYSWKAIYAETEAKFDSIIKEMCGKIKVYDTVEQCKKWSIEEAEVKNALQAPLRK